MAGNEAMIAVMVFHVTERAADLGLTPGEAIRLNNFRRGERAELDCEACGGPRRTAVFRDVAPDRYPGMDLMICLTCRTADLRSS